jgi:hypothetical protein
MAILGRIMNRPEVAQLLRSIAQNDYMIDGYYLPSGVILNRVADYLERTCTCGAYMASGDEHHTDRCALLSEVIE